MDKDDRDSFDMLRTELEFIERGGYGRSVKSPWQPTSIFQDSPSCLNFSDLEKPHPCRECMLIDFVPPQNRLADVPCHYIPLNAAGETIDHLESNEEQRDLEETVKDWLRATIQRMETQHATRERRDSDHCGL